MEEIRILEKPDWITWDEIARCIQIGQATNNKKGFDMQFGHMTGEELQKDVQGDSGEGYTLVALNEKNEVVGTHSLTITYKKKWWHKGRCGLRCNTAILPEYRGTDAYFGLCEEMEKKEKELGLNVIWATTSEKNDVVLKINKKRGWKFVEYIPQPMKRDYFSYLFVTWKDGCPFSDRYIDFRLKMSKFYSKNVYKYNGTMKVNRFTHWLHKDR